MALMDQELSEPYSIFTYRFFLHKWPGLCVRALVGDEMVGVVICKAEQEPDRHGNMAYTGYIAMLAVSDQHRKKGIGSSLVRLAMQRMKDLGCDQAMLETEVSNTKALRLYDRLGFLRDERLVKYYMNGGDAFRLRLWFEPREQREAGDGAVVRPKEGTSSADPHAESPLDIPPGAVPTTGNEAAENE
eukprot:CAMPEP_0118985166 /NCGR_PEP_ID=MMETSP1173-20130426/39365_1 /TAXON_ID=1034831 /ORGANISM="Rhizochromulina marina cf, Strain CCMP1243" /LENGTH=187 /DNA_ID=CAMNT_0006935871 /DNA_START=6 /DNA_END=567 /DNA_ORIENTATION=+